MKHIEIKAKYRKEIGKSSSKKLRKDGQVPGIIYGGSKNINFYAHENEFIHLVYTPETFLVDLDIEGDKYFCYLQDLQFHPVTDKIIHIDFIEIQENVPIKISIPIKIVGKSVGEESGGKQISNMRKLKIKGLVKDLPDAIEVDVSHIDIGQSIQVKDISFDNLESLDGPSNMVVIIKSARGIATGMELEEDKEEEVAEETEEGEEGEEGKETDAEKEVKGGKDDKGGKGESSEKSEKSEKTEK